MGININHPANTISRDSTIFLTTNGEISASRKRLFSTKASDYTLTISDDYVRFNGTSLTATLPTAVGIDGHEFIIKNLNATSLIIATTSSQTIDGAATVALTQYQFLRIVSNGGAGWDVL
jgi:hypothetical protein